MKIGILALQGAVEPHKKKLEQLGAKVIEVRTPQDLDGLHGIILPGGESTTFIHLLHLNSLWEPLKKFASERPTWGVCAGAILLAKKVSHPAQESLGLMDISIERNAFGRQVDSFIDLLVPTADIWQPMEGVFIRAPRVREVGPGIRINFTWKDEPVMLEAGNLVVTTFHPELTEDHQIHQYFLQRCRLPSAT